MPIAEKTLRNKRIIKLNNMGLSCRQIAKLHDIHPSTVHNIIERERRRLKK